MIFRCSFYGTSIMALSQKTSHNNTERKLSRVGQAFVGACVNQAFMGAFQPPLFLYSD
jgi:hypothetical protein